MAVVVSGANQAIGAEFDVGIDITAAQTDYVAWQASVNYDPNILAWVPVGENGWTYTGLGGLTNEAVASAHDIVPLDTVNDSTLGGAATDGQVISATGTVATVRFKCIAGGSSPLHLVTRAERSPLGTFLIDADGGAIPTDLTDASVTCGGEAPAATPTPGEGPTATATPGGPAPTPAVPGATPTPLPPGFEAVGLAAGCNPVATTYADATPIGTIAGAVGPAGNLEALWEFEGTAWQGYSPAYPEASDLTAKDFLDVVFVCVTGPGAFVRPIV